MAHIYFDIPVPKKWWHFLLLPVTIPFTVIFVAVLVLLFYGVACLNEWGVRKL